ncbi:MAG TPA: hypothetical protein VLB82_06805, partial [Thermodesulfobacteriota bacterium]|nr:hypothetical protein [Thermodesulfobacteriota bacterium]
TDFTTIPQSNESIFDFPTSGLILGASVALNSVGFLPAGGTLFNIGSRDQKDPQILLTASAPEPDSNVIGSFYWNRNSTETIINSTASDGAITQFVDSGGGIVTATSIAHGLLNGDIIDISETTNYNGRFTISNVTTDTFSFTSPFNGDDATGIFQFGWVKVGGTTFQGEVERASMTGNNALLFLNLEPRKVLVTVSLTVLRGSGSGSPIAGFSVFRNGQQFLTSNNDAIIGNVVTNSTNSVQFSLNIPGTVIDGDTFELYTRNETNSSNILVQFGTVIIN